MPDGSKTTCSSSPWAFIKHNFKQSIEDALRNIFLINQFSLEEMQVMKSKKDDIILQLKQKISDLKQFNTNISL